MGDTYQKEESVNLSPEGTYGNLVNGEKIFSATPIFMVIQGHFRMFKTGSGKYLDRNERHNWYL